jgi:hypothetical protein
MREYQIAFLGLLLGVFLIIGFSQGYGEGQLPRDDVESSRPIGNTEPVGEKFGGGIKVHEIGEDSEVDLDPTGPGGN